MKSLKRPPQIAELIPFDKDLIEIVKTVEFKKISSNFQKQLQQDINSINNTETTPTFADKTTNMHKLSKNEYDELFNDWITSNYKKFR